eukprot:EG_transcript_25496
MYESPQDLSGSWGLALRATQGKGCGAGGKDSSSEDFGQANAVAPPTPLVQKAFVQIPSSKGRSSVQIIAAELGWEVSHRIYCLSPHRGQGFLFSGFPGTPHFFPIVRSPSLSSPLLHLSSTL